MAHPREVCLSWLGIARLGLVQASIGAVVVLATSTMNRVMVVELSLPALLPGALIALHYTIQIVRPRLGHGSDIGGRRVPWIIGGMALLAAGGIGAALSVAEMAARPVLGIAAAVMAFAAIGIGVGAAGTSLLVLLAQQVAPARRAGAASVVWIMMIVGFVVTAGTAGQMLDPFSYARLVEVTAIICGIAFVIPCLAVWRIEPRRLVEPSTPGARATRQASFSAALQEVWNERRARAFAIFVFVSMLGYSAQELILEPFAGAVFHLPPGESTKLTSLQHGGALLGMIMVALLGNLDRRNRHGLMRVWTIGGCAVSAAALFALACAGFVGPAWPLRPSVFALGIGNGAFAVAAIGSMMGLARDGAHGGVTDGGNAREGVRMGLWGAAQAVAFALGGLLASFGVDLGRRALGSPVTAYAIVFCLEAGLFLIAAWLAAGVFRVAAAPHRTAHIAMPNSAVNA